MCLLGCGFGVTVTVSGIGATICTRQEIKGSPISRISLENIYICYKKLSPVSSNSGRLAAKTENNRCSCEVNIYTEAFSSCIVHLQCEMCSSQCVLCSEYCVVCSVRFVVCNAHCNM